MINGSIGGRSWSGCWALVLRVIIFDLPRTIILSSCAWQVRTVFTLVDLYGFNLIKRLRMQ